MRDFEELEGMNQPEEEAKPGSTENQEEDEDDENFRPINCTTLSSADIYYELDKRGIKSTGFPDTDREILQKAFDEEFQADLEDARARRKEAKRRAQLQAGLQKRRMLMEATLQEEQDALATNHQLSMMLEMVRENQVSTSLRLDLDSITARVLAKAMWANDTLTCLDLTSNDLNDHAGSYLARILKRNNTIKKLELDSNEFGLRTCLALGESLKENSSLVYLSLDSNPLVDNSNGDVSGIKALSDSLKTNTTLTSLNMWRTQIPDEGGEYLASAMEGNSTLLFCEVGHNRIDACDKKRIAEKLDVNLAAFEAAGKFRGVIEGGYSLYTGGVLSRAECCIRQLWCSSIILHNITIIAHDHYTNIYLKHTYFYACRTRQAQGCRDRGRAYAEGGRCRGAAQKGH